MKNRELFMVEYKSYVKGCRCYNVEIGSYDNQVKLMPPSWSSHPFVCVDRCLWNEIVELWDIGIQTTGCCCGHRKHPGYVGVIDADIPRMREMGYLTRHNNSRPDDWDTFYPKLTMNDWELKPKQINLTNLTQTPQSKLT